MQFWDNQEKANSSSKILEYELQLQSSSALQKTLDVTKRESDNFILEEEHISKLGFERPPCHFASSLYSLYFCYPFSNKVSLNINIQNDTKEGWHDPYIILNDKPIGDVLMKATNGLWIIYVIFRIPSPYVMVWR